MYRDFISRAGLDAGAPWWQTRQHFLYFRSLPQGQGEFRPTFPASRILALADDSFWQEAHVQAAG